MMIRFFEHLVSLDVGWIMYDLLWVLVAMTFMMYCFHYKGDNKRGVLGFAILMLLLWGVIDIVRLFGFRLFPVTNILEFILFNFTFVLLITNTKLVKHELLVLVLVAVFMSWWVT